jgi:hypothetical protein
MDSDTPKSIEDLDKILEQQKQKRGLEYKQSKWLFALSIFFGGPHLSYGIGTFPDLVENDKAFWKLLSIGLLIYAVFGAGLYLIFIKNGTSEYSRPYLAIAGVISFLVIRILLGVFIYKKMKKVFPNGKGLLMQSVFFLFSFRLIAILTVILGLYFLYFLNKL